MDFFEGSVHGRFQPPHNDHLKYILAAKEKCKFLWIGISRYDIREDLPSPQAQHRKEKFSNPLTYFERLEIISEMLLDEGIDQNSFGYIPFPIDQPKKLPDFLPIHIPCFTTICEDWNHHKIRQLQEVGYTVIVLWEELKKEIDGCQIRDMIYNNVKNWQQMVPPATIKAVNKLRLNQRLKKLKDK